MESYVIYCSTVHQDKESYGDRFFIECLYELLKCLHKLLVAEKECRCFGIIIKDFDAMAMGIRVPTEYFTDHGLFSQDSEKSAHIPTEPPFLIIGQMVKAGLTTVLRWIVQHFHSEHFLFGFNHLLGYRETCFKACAEVSPWTDYVTRDMVNTLQCSCNRSAGRSIKRFLLDLEEKLARKHPVPSYKHSHFKVKGNDHLNRYYASVVRNVGSNSFVTGPLPNLVDVLVYLMLTVQFPDAELMPYPLILNWIEKIKDFPGITTISSIMAENPNSLLLKKSRLAELCGVCSLSVHVHEDPSSCATEQDRDTIIDRNIVKRLRDMYDGFPVATSVNYLVWDSLPDLLDPAKGGKLPSKRAHRKKQQLENMYHYVVETVKLLKGDPITVVDFCAGCGHLGLIIAYLYPKLKVILIENKEESLSIAASRAKELKLNNISLYQIGISLHACGVVTDLVIEKCLKHQATVIVCPCCYGSIGQSNLKLPRSRRFQEAITEKEAIILRHSADKTEQGIADQVLGQECMTFVDLDRLHYMEEHGGYIGSLYFMDPQTCSPKNHILHGVPSTEVY